MFPVKQRAAALVAAMTPQERAAQLVHTAPAVRRLGIPSYNWWGEALHGVARAGVATVFPQALALAACFDEDLLGEVARAISTEARAKYHEFQREGDHGIYKGLTFWSPNVNIFRDPRWGRGHETYGEDPFLTARLGVRFIQGLQGPDRDSLKVAACAKHFAVHSGPEGERHRFNAVCDLYDLWNTYLPAFEAAVREAGVEAVMGAYNRTLGEPCCGSELLLERILRGKWGFDGHVVSDCWAIKDFHESHKVTDTPLQSVALAVSNGCDVNCGVLFGLCEEAVEQGLLRQEQVDDAAARLITARMRLGLLGAPENPAYTSIPYEAVDCPEHRALNLDAARRGLVLLKNDGALPLDPNALKTVGVIGPNADSRRALEGNYEGRASEYRTVLQGVRALAEDSGVRVLFAEGCHLYRDKQTALGEVGDRLAEARSVARHSDAVILCLGLDADVEGEEGDAYSLGLGGDKPDIELPAPQSRLLETVAEACAGKPLILVMLVGSAMALTFADEHCNGVLQAFYPGAMGGTAIAEALFGRFSPEGKLPVTFYRSTDDLPDFRDYGMAGRTYRYFRAEPLYPFGFGLGYAEFSLEDLEASAGGCAVTVRNRGAMRARETLQVYAASPGTRELRSLCGFAKVLLEPGESRRVRIPLRESAFARWDEQGDLQTIPGTHTLYVGFCQPDERSAALYGTAPLSARVTVA
jgi:beta-glucosidase